MEVWLLSFCNVLYSCWAQVGANLAKAQLLSCLNSVSIMLDCTYIFRIFFMNRSCFPVKNGLIWSWQAIWLKVFGMLRKLDLSALLLYSTKLMIQLGNAGDHRWFHWLYHSPSFVVFKPICAYLNASALTCSGSHGWCGIFCAKLFQYQRQMGAGKFFSSVPAFLFHFF